MKPCLRLWMIVFAAITVASVPTASAQNLLWSQADVNTILLGKEPITGFGAYNSGRIHDLLILQSTGGILVGAENGGVWLVSSNGSALAVSNSWDRPDINAMTFGFGNEKHVFAGGSGLYVTDYNSLFPYLSWFDISPQGGVLQKTDLIYKVATVTHDTADGPKSYVVIATSRGIWTSELPPTPAGPYNWQPAAGGGKLPFGPYSGLASGPEGSGIIVAGFFKALSGFNLTPTPAIYKGTFDSSGTLNMSAANIQGTASTALQPGMIGYVSLDSCASQADRMYASVYDTNGSLFDLLRSNDSGASWAALSKTFDDGDPNNDLIYWSKFMGNSGSGDWIKHISVSPTAPDSVTVPGFGGIRTGDGGTTWHSMGASWTSKGHLTPLTVSYHADWHVARQHPADPMVVFAGTDGGLLNSYNWLFNHFFSDFNSRLHTLEFGSNPLRNFEAECDTESGVAEGLIAGGLQDNGDVFLKMSPLASTPWTQFVCGDGGQNQFFNVSAANGWVLHSSILGWNPLTATAVLNFAPWLSNSFCSGGQGITLIPPVKKDPNGKKRPEGLDGQVRAVYRPAYMKGGRLMFALVGEQASINTDSFPNSVFGLFANPNKLGTDMEWEHLGDLPTAVTTTAAYDGDPVVCGGADGNIYTLDPKNGNVQMMSMNTPFPNGTAYRILYRLPALPICAYSAVGANPKGAVLQFNSVQWNPILKFNDQAIQDIQVDESVSPEAIYVATDNRVYSSPDAGKNWFTDSKGLPERFHGSQLKIVRYSNGEKWLYLTTYGRSVWAANMAGNPFTH